ncbi:MAG: hypothetical protein KIT83_19705 [Bryobacterales bacterium]|nr:hypothetical protein [Rhodoferax sp.]MCW5966273.1 hypothetical protein [Bryobacterales bacterium]
MLTLGTEKSGTRDFNGRLITQGEQIRAWGIRIAPTVLFFGRGGKEATGKGRGGSQPASPA